jgi:hypothetical protein
MTPHVRTLVQWHGGRWIGMAPGAREQEFEVAELHTLVVDNGKLAKRFNNINLHP